MFGFNRPYVRNPQAISTPVYMSGESASFYFNSDTIIDDPDFDYFEFWLLDSFGNQVVLISAVSHVLVAGTVGYNLYLSNFVFPYVDNGQYFFQIYNALRGFELFRSNIILVDCSPETILRTTPVKFRHNDRLYGVRYDLLPDFYQKFRLPFNQIKAPEPRADRTQYRQSSNGRELRNTKSFRDIVLFLEMYYGSDSDIGAVSAMLEHTEIYVSGNRLISMTQAKPDKPSEFSNLQKANFEVIVDDWNLDNRTLDTYGDFILWGGGTNNIINTFVSG